MNGIVLTLLDGFAVLAIASGMAVIGIYGVLRLLVRWAVGWL